jgi:hypothetical protein
MFHETSHRTKCVDFPATVIRRLSCVTFFCSTTWLSAMSGASTSKHYAMHSQQLGDLESLCHELVAASTDLSWSELQGPLALFKDWLFISMHVARA